MIDPPPGWHIQDMPRLSRIFAGLICLVPAACTSDGSVDDTQHEDDGASGEDEAGEDEIGEFGGCDQTWALMAFDLDGGALVSTTYELPADWRLTGKLGHGDFDGDGLTDVVYGQRIIFGPINASSEVVELDVGEFVVTDARAVDLDDDGRDELALALLYEQSFMADVAVFDSNEAREISEVELPEWKQSATSSLLELAAGDVSGDGLPDLVLGAADFNSGEDWAQFAILLGDGSGAFSGFELIDYVHPDDARHAVVSITLADLDGVGGLDILSSHRISSYSGSTPSEFLLVTTGVSEGAPVHTQTDFDHNHSGATFADLDQDGLLDALSLDWDWKVRLAPGLEGGGFGDPVLAFEGEVRGVNRASVEVADLDGDGRPDLLAGGGVEAGDVALAQGLEGGILSEPLYGEVPGSEVQMLGAKVFDIDNDGDLEAVAGVSWCDFE